MHPKSIRRQFIVAFLTFFISGLWVPNINWASVRSLVARAQADMRVFAAALDSYHADHGAYPISAATQSNRVVWKSDSPMPTFIKYQYGSSYSLSTPTAYISTLIPDPFRYLHEDRTYSYYRWNDHAYILSGAGPNCVFDIRPEEFDAMKPAADGKLPEILINYQYDPTNGEVSAGDIYLVGPIHKGQQH